MVTEALVMEVEQEVIALVNKITNLEYLGIQLDCFDSIEVQWNL